MSSIFRVFRLGIRVAAWATPHVQRWHRERNMDRTEGDRHLQARNWAEAEKHFSQALEQRHSARKRVEIYLGLEEAERKQGKLHEAEQSARSAIQTAFEARDAALVSAATDALAGVQIARGDFAGASATIAEIERIETGLPKADPARLAQCARRQGEVLCKSGRIAEATQAFERCVKLTEQGHGAKHLETANSLAELGAIYRQIGNHSAAQTALRRALDIYRTTAGPSSEEAAVGLSNLAMSLEESGDLETAAREYERVLSVMEQQVGGNREDSADVKLRLAALYIQLERTSAARELLLFAIGVFEHKKNHRLRDALEIMAVADDLAGRAADAQRWRDKAASLQPASPAPTTAG